MQECALSSATLPSLEQVMTKEKAEAIRRFLSKWFVPGASVVVVLGALLSSLTYVIRSEIKSEISSVANDVGVLKSDVGTLKTQVQTLHGDITSTGSRIDDLLRDAFERAFPKPAAVSNNPKSSLKRANDILQLARSENIKLNPQMLAEFGKSVAAISRNTVLSDAAWQTLTKLADYKAFLNADQSPTNNEVFISPPPGTAWEPTAHFSFKASGSGSATFTWPNRLVDQSQEFIYQPIDDSSPLPARGHPYAKVSANTPLVLDGFRLRNVIFDGVTIIYDGGPLEMESVWFVNCKFQLKSLSQARELVEAMLEHVPTTLSIS